MLQRRRRGENASASLAEGLHLGAVIDFRYQERMNLVPHESDNPDMELALPFPSIRTRYSMLGFGPCRVTGEGRFFRKWMFSISTPMEKAMAK